MNSFSHTKKKKKNNIIVLFLNICIYIEYRYLIIIVFRSKGLCGCIWIVQGLAQSTDGPVKFKDLWKL